MAVRGGEHTAMLYYSSRRHAGENLQGLLEKREAGLDKPLAMSDALASKAVADASRRIRCHYALLGALRSGRGYRSYDVFLAARVFDADFSEALTIFLHEHAHIFGYDGSRGFTDALTGLLETALGRRRDLDRYEVGWEHVRAAVRRERQERGEAGEADYEKEWLSALSETEVRQMLEQVLMTVRRKLRRNRP